MAFQYPHLKSETPGAVPLAANMVVGQLAINVADKKFFTKTAAGVVVDITPAVSSGAPTGTKTSALTAAAAVAAANEFAINEAGVSKKVTAAQIKTFVGGAADITPLTNAAANSSYPVGAYAFNALATDGYTGDGRLTGARNGTLNAQRLQLWTNGNTYARYWIEGSAAWSAWSLYLDALDFTAKGQAHFAAGANAAGVLPGGADGQALVADSTQALGVKWAVPTGGAPTGTKVSAMAAAAAVAAADEFVINKAGVSQKVTAAQIKTFTGGGASNAYSTLINSSGSHTAGRAAGTYWIGQGDPLGINGVGTLYPPNIIYLAAADYPANGALTAKLRIRLQLFSNDVAPTGNYTFGLYPVTRPATSGGAGLNIYTLGTVVPGTAAFNNPAADGLLQAATSDFALPADGYYVIGMVSTATVATSAHIHISAALQIHYT